MGLFSFLKGKQKIKGSIAYHGLEEWWLSELTDIDREIILEKYKSLGTGSCSIIEGNISSTSQTKLSLLSGMVGWFKKEEERYLTYKIIEKAEKLINSDTNILDIHFLYGAKQHITYKDRDTKPNGIELAIDACKQQISCSSKAAKGFLKEYNGAPLPSHKGYYQLAIILEKAKEYDKAIATCKQALSQGWAGDWGKRIERCKKKNAA